MDPNKSHYVVATGIVVKDSRYLIAKRSESEKAFPGKWTVPGGKLEMSDYTKRTPDTTSGQWYNICEDVVVREIEEEVGLKVKNIKYLTSLVFVRPDNIPTLVVSLFADYHNGEVKLCKDLTDHAWVTLEEAKNYDLIDGIYDEIIMLDAHLNGDSLGAWKKSV